MAFGDNFVTIVSDGITNHTKVILPDGTQLPGVCGIRLNMVGGPGGDRVVFADVKLYARLDVKAKLKPEWLPYPGHEDTEELKEERE